jgi:SNF2 family DNA or RNA helicase
MGRTRRKKKQSGRTVRLKTLRAKGNKKRRRETREDFSRKEKYMRRTKGNVSSVGPAQLKGKLRPYLHTGENVFSAQQ